MISLAAMVCTCRQKYVGQLNKAQQHIISWRRFGPLFEAFRGIFGFLIRSFILEFIDSVQMGALKWGLKRPLFAICVQLSTILHMCAPLAPFVMELSLQNDDNYRQSCEDNSGQVP